MSDIQATPFASCSDSKSKTPAQRAPHGIHTATAPLSAMRFRAHWMLDGFQSPSRIRGLVFPCAS
jgi:hypothetical protein